MDSRDGQKSSKKLIRGSLWGEFLCGWQEEGKGRERGEGTRLVCEDAERRCTGSPWNLRILSLNTFYLEVVITKPTPLSVPRLLRYPPVDRCVSVPARSDQTRGNRFAPLWPLVSSSSIITIDPFTWIRLYPGTVTRLFIPRFYFNIPTSVGFRKLEIIAAVSAAN